MSNKEKEALISLTKHLIDICHLLLFNMANGRFALLAATRHVIFASEFMQLNIDAREFSAS